MTEPAIVHPEWVDGRRLWMDTPMRDLIHRIRFGDPVKGWEGDARLELYWNGEQACFELFRLEDDEQYRFVCRSTKGMPFDDRVIDALIAWDGRRRTTPIHEQVIEHNTRLDENQAKTQDEWIAEEMAPRLQHAFRKDA